VKSVKRGLTQAAKRAGLEHVSPHDLRRSAAIHMAEDGVPISEISQFLGHSNERITFSTYARFQPDHLRRAANALEFDDLEGADEEEKGVKPCPACDTKTEEWWSYCAMCGYHIAAGDERPPYPGRECFQPMCLRLVARRALSQMPVDRAARERGWSTYDRS
jgi:hypothetical protein